jgi:glutamine amidotransferase
VITVVDYGMGNLRNVARALRTLGEEVLVTADPAAIVGASRLIIPGVGAFGEAVRRIDRLGLRGPLLQHAQKGKPLLGICLGMQLLYSASEESPGVAGLSLLEGEVVRFPDGVKSPHIGWNDVRPTRASSLFAAEEPVRCFYFVHSYFVPASPSAAATTDHGGEFVSAVEKESVAGVQFHPEKSQDAGLRVLSRFLWQTRTQTA